MNISVDSNKGILETQTSNNGYINIVEQNTFSKKIAKYPSAAITEVYHFMITKCLNYIKVVLSAQWTMRFPGRRLKKSQSEVASL